MKTTVEIVMKYLKSILIYTALVFTICFGCRNYFRGAEWRYNVNVAYVYEGEDSVHHVTTEYVFIHNATIKDIEVTFSTEPGYINCLNLLAKETIIGGSGGERFVNKHIMEVPDKKFKVVEISYIKGPKTEN